MKTYEKTEELMSGFMFENKNPNVDTHIWDNEDGTITIILEGVAEKIFPKPKDFDSYIN